MKGVRLPPLRLLGLQRLLDEVLLDPRIDAERVGMWGISRGGLETLFWTPLETRIKVAVICGFFNHRRNKMVVPEKCKRCNSTKAATRSTWKAELPS